MIMMIGGGFHLPPRAPLSPLLSSITLLKGLIGSPKPPTSEDAYSALAWLCGGPSPQQQQDTCLAMQTSMDGEPILSPKSNMVEEGTSLGEAAIEEMFGAVKKQINMEELFCVCNTTWWREATRP